MKVSRSYRPQSAIRHVEGFLAAWLACLVLLPSAAYADKYVRQGSTGNGSGTDWTNACSGFTGNCAVSALSRPDTVWVADGSYGGLTLDRAANGTAFIRIKKATAADHGTDTGWLGSYGDGQAQFTALHISTSYWVIDGNGTLPDGGDFRTASYGFKVNVPVGTGQRGSNISNGASHLEFHSIHYSCASSNEQRGMRFYNGGRDVLVRNVQVSGMGDDPILLHTYEDLTLEYVWIHTRQTSDGAHADAIVVTTSPPAAGTKNTLRYSRIDWPGQQMWFDAQGTPNFGEWDIYGNLFINTTSPNSPPPSNTALKMNSPELTTSGPIQVYNNTFWGLYNAFVNDSDVGGVTVRNNIFFKLENGVSFGSYSHDSNYFDVALGSTINEPNAHIGGNPFTDAAKGDFRLAIRTGPGTAMPSPYNKDVSGNLRGADGFWDLGSFECLSCGLNTAPSPPTNVRIIR